jgi:hypothetical protein
MNLRYRMEGSTVPSESKNETASSFQDFEVDFFKPEDAEGIARLFRAVYGEDYPIKIFYDPKALTQANATGDYYSIVARTPAGDVIGVHHLFRSAPCKSLYEVGSGMVLKEYRQFGINKSMLNFLYEEWVPTKDNVEEVFGEAVCNHPYMQKTVLDARHLETALEVALMPAAAYDKEKSSTGRVAALLMFRSYASGPHKVYIPAVYERELRFMYEGLDDVREVSLAAGPIPEHQVSHAEMKVFDFAQVARIAIDSVGNDFEQYVDDVENRALDQNVLVIQLWLDLSVPWVGPAVDILRNKGFFLGGVLPRWFDHDGMLMQKLFCSPDFDGIRLHSERSHKILEMVKQDWGRAQDL